MKHNKLKEALNQVSDKHLAEAAAPRRPQRLWWLGAVAAMLAVVIFASSMGSTLANPATGTPQSTAPGSFLFPVIPNVHLSALMAEPEYPKMAEYPQDPNWDDKGYDEWRDGLSLQYDQPAGYADSLDTFFTKSLPLFLDSGEENAVCSPLNIYMALAMLAEVTDGDSRAAVLDALNADSIEALREQAGHVWNAHYRDDGVSTSLLGNSLWLEEGYQFNQATVDTLAGQYYASVFQGDLGSDAMNQALRSWLSQQTKGLLDDQISQESLDDNAILALASTIYFRAGWSGKFREENNTQDTFHAPSGDREVTYMNRTMSYGPYYYGEDYGAVALDLDLGMGKMWLILPDEGKTPADLLESGHYQELLRGAGESKGIMVHLSLPKFDVSGRMDLMDSFAALGLGSLFDASTADFSAILPQDEGVFLGGATHAARVTIDEEGVEAAAYTLLAAAGAALPPEEEVYFTLDRPFLFVIESQDGLPLFAGVVNEP